MNSELPDTDTATACPVPMRRGRLLACTFGHAFNDSLANFVPPLWFTVQSLFGLSNSAVGLISLLLSTTTNFGQPIFGYIVDRYRLRNVIPISLLVATVFVSVVGFMPNLTLFVAAMMIAGFGVALFHPRGGALAAEASGSRRALGMSIFGAGGAIGYALAALVAPLLHDLGKQLGLGDLQGFIFVLPPGLVGVALLVKYNPGRAVEGPAISRPAVTDNSLQPDGMPSLEATTGRLIAGPSNDPSEHFSLRRHLVPHLGRIAPLFAIMVLRSATVIAYATFIQILQGRLERSTLFQGAVLFTFVGGAAVGSIIFGHLSDLYGRRFITIITLLLSLPPMYFALHAPPVLVLVLLLLGGALLRGAESVNIAATQDLLPQGMSTASAISMGFSWGVAGFIAPIVGFISDSTGNLSLALATTLSLPVIAAIVAIHLPTRPIPQQNAPTSAPGAKIVET